MYNGFTHCTLSYGHDPSAGVATHHDEIFGRRMEACTAHDGCQRLARHGTKKFALGIKDFHATGFVHASRAENVQFGVPSCLERGQPASRLVIVSNAVGWFDGFVALDEVSVLRQIQAIGKRCRQQALSAGRKEGTAHGQAGNLCTKSLW